MLMSTRPTLLENFFRIVYRTNMEIRNAHIQKQEISTASRIVAPSLIPSRTERIETVYSDALFFVVILMTDSMKIEIAENMRTATNGYISVRWTGRSTLLATR